MNYKTNKNDMGVNDEVRRLSTWFPTDGQERILTGWSSLDEKLGGLRNGELMVVSGYSNMGKTTFVTNLINNISVEQVSLHCSSLSNCQSIWFLNLCCLQ